MQVRIYLLFLTFVRFSFKFLRYEEDFTYFGHHFGTFGHFFDPKPQVQDGSTGPKRPNRAHRGPQRELSLQSFPDPKTEWNLERRPRLPVDHEKVKPESQGRLV